MMDVVRASKVSKNNQIWLPIRFEQAGSNIVVHLVDAQKVDLSLGFFRHSLSALPKGCNPEKIIHLDKWLEQDVAINSPTTVALLFHISRCGSTLLCQNIKASKKFLVLSEPAILGHIYNHNKVIPDVLRKQVVQQVVAQWSYWAAQQNKILAIKPSSIILLSQAVLRQDLISYKAVFLYREPTAVVESLTRRKAPKFLAHVFSVLEPRFSREIQNRHSVKCLRAIQAYARYIKEIPHSYSVNTLCIDYQNLSSSFVQILDFLGANLQTLENEDKLWSDYWYSKSRTFEDEPHVPISKQAMCAFEAENHNVLSPLKWDYEQLREKLAGSKVDKDANNTPLTKKK